jgi:hypothetical protein
LTELASATFVMPIVAVSCVKHSAVVSVCVPIEYSAEEFGA